MQQRMTLYKTLYNVEKARDNKERVRLLQKYSSAALKAVLGYAFDPDVVWLLPETDPPYKPMAANTEHEGALGNEYKKLFMFVKGPTDTQKNLKQHRREHLFIQMLETIEPDDAVLLLSIKNKKLPFPSITKGLVKEAFPNLAKNW